MLRAFFSIPQFVWKQVSIAVKHNFRQWLRRNLREEPAGREEEFAMRGGMDIRRPLSHPGVGLAKQVILKIPGAPYFGIPLSWESPTLAGGFSHHLSLVPGGTSLGVYNGNLTD